MIIVTGTIGWGDAVRTLAIIKKLKKDFVLICNAESSEFFENFGIDHIKVNINYIPNDFSLIGGFFRIISRIGEILEIKRMIEEMAREHKEIFVIQDLFFTLFIPFLKKKFERTIVLTNLGRIINFDVPKELEDQLKMAKLAFEEIKRNYDIIIYDDFIEKEFERKGNIFRVGLIVREFKKVKIEEKYPLFVFSGWEGSKKYFDLIKDYFEDLVIIGRKIEGFRSFGFVKDVENYISKAKFVISTAGISTISECIYFRKPMLLIPIKNHLEQYVNAKTIKSLRFGEVFEGENSIERFLDNLKVYKENLERRKINLEGAKTISKILEGDLDGEVKTC